VKKSQLITAACAALMWTAAAGVPTVAAQTPGAPGGPPSGSQAGSSGATAAPSDVAGQDDMSNRTSAKAESSDLQQFVEKASIVNMAEIQLGQLAVERAQDPQVKQFAQTMIDDHTKAQEQLKTVAGSQNLPIPSALDSKHQKLHDKLAKLQGAEFDRAYMDAMVDGHKDAEKLLKKRVERKDKSTASNVTQAPPSSGSGAVGTSGTDDASSSGTAPTSGTMRENESASASERDADRAASTSSASSASESAAGAPASPDEWAAMTLPKVRAHLEQARALEEQVKQAGRSNDRDRGPDANSPQAPSPAGPDTQPPSPSGSGSNPPSGTTPPPQQ
jgi:putative membrane protein